MVMSFLAKASEPTEMITNCLKLPRKSYHLKLAAEGETLSNLI